MNARSNSPSGKIPTVLSIAGSDPSGGAGIQADLKTFSAIGVYGAAVITALTAQNTREVSGVMTVPADFVSRQLEAVLTDIRVDVIKLGMIPSAPICDAVAPWLEGCTVVCDPVMVATTGCRLIEDAAIEALKAKIIPKSTYITPNLFELEVLYGRKPKDFEAAGLELMNQYGNLSGVVLKGGHDKSHPDVVTDMLLFWSEGRVESRIERHARLSTGNTHGTGCTFSSAFSSYLARGLDPPAAFSKSVHFTAHLIAAAENAGVGRGAGPLLHHLWNRR